MGNIIIPEDRTQKQPATAYCTNPECLESSDQQRFEFPWTHAAVECPKCGANQAPMVGVLALVHFLHRDREGKIVGSGGLRYSLACSKGRAHLATNTNEEAATGDLRAVNCPGCLKAAHDMKLAAISGLAMKTKE